jgi:putative Mg2+ transporter-C (MgtC) family protein
MIRGNVRRAQRRRAIPLFEEFITGAQDAFLRLVAATLIGAAVGLNRELRGKPAGMRTHALVSLGAALVTLSSIALATHGGTVDANAVTRAVQGIIAGVGFLGGGVILKTSEGRTGVRNLTTAASVWVVACLGIVCGAGQWTIASSGLALTLLVLVIGGPIEGGVRRLALRWMRPNDPRALERLRSDRRRTGEHRSIMHDEEN